MFLMTANDSPMVVRAWSTFSQQRVTDMSWLAFMIGSLNVVPPSLYDLETQEEVAESHLGSELINPALK